MNWLSAISAPGACIVSALLLARLSQRCRGQGDDLGGLTPPIGTGPGVRALTGKQGADGLRALDGITRPMRSRSGWNAANPPMS